MDLPPPVWPLGSGTDITSADLPAIQEYERQLAAWNSIQVAKAQAATQAAAQAAAKQQAPVGKDYYLSNSGGRRSRRSRKSKRSKSRRRR
jgi:hypothetical protein